MKIFWKFVKTTLIGGVFFVLPFGMLIYAFMKALTTFRAVVSPIVELIPEGVIERVTLVRILALVLLLLLCFLVGLLASTAPIQKIKKWIEEHILVLIPGYSILKSVGENMAGLNKDNLKEVVAINMSEAWQIGFKMDELDDGLSVVFVPAAPNALNGDVLIVPNENVRILDITDVDTMRFFTLLGAEAHVHLKDSVHKDLFQSEDTKNPEKEP